jgi:hypothetical protein
LFWVVWTFGFLGKFHALIDLFNDIFEWFGAISRFVQSVLVHDNVFWREFTVIFE